MIDKDETQERALTAFETFFESNVKTEKIPRLRMLGYILLTVFLISFVLILEFRWSVDKDLFGVPGSGEFSVLLGIFLGVGVPLLLGLRRSKKYTMVSPYRQMAEFLSFHYEEGGKLPVGVVAAQEMGFIQSQEPVQTFSKVQKELLITLQRIVWDEYDDETTITYHAFVFSCHLDRPVQGTTILVSDSLQAKMKGKIHGLKRVKLEWLKFEEVFDLFSNDEKEVRHILAPDVMAVLYDFYHVWEDKSMCFVFQGNTFSCFFFAGRAPSEDTIDKWPWWPTFYYLYAAQEFPDWLQHKLLARPDQEQKLLQLERQRQAKDLQRKCPVNQPDKRGITPLMASILAGDYPQFTRYLAEPHADVNQRFAQNGNTLLHLAVVNNQPEIARALLEKNASLAEVKNAAGQTALDVARERHFTEIIALLSN